MLRAGSSSMPSPTAMGAAAVASAALACAVARLMLPEVDARMTDAELRVRAAVAEAAEALCRFVGLCPGGAPLAGDSVPEAAESGAEATAEVTAGTRATAALKRWVCACAAHSDDAKLLRVDARATGGMVGATVRLNLRWEPEDAGPRTLILKRRRPGRGAAFGTLLSGRDREARLFDESTWPQFVDTRAQFAALRAVMPRALAARRSGALASFTLLLEDLDEDRHTLADHLLGHQCWPPVRIREAAACPPETVLETLLMRAADLHAAFWQSPLLLKPENAWLKASQWFQGRDRGRWEIGHMVMQRAWANVKRARAEGSVRTEWSPRLFRLVDDAVSATRWSTYQAGFDMMDQMTPWTLTHGDWHGNNILWPHASSSALASGRESPADARALFVDWAEVGIGCPFSEIAYFMITNTGPSAEFRRRVEHKMLRKYHARLIQQGVPASNCPWDVAWSRYKAGGINRWAQTLVLISDYALRAPLPPALLQWFHDMLLAFVEDHAVSSREYVMQIGELGGGLLG